MNGCQLAGLMAWAAPTMNRRTTATFTNTITLLTLADSLIPMTSSVVMIAMMMTAGRLKTAVTLDPSASETTYPDHPIATVTAPSAYSSTRSQPMIQANTSPRVA